MPVEKNLSIIFRFCAEFEIFGGNNNKYSVKAFVDRARAAGLKLKS
jgi:hypothetical protein